jgi:hypothetical protein
METVAIQAPEVESSDVPPTTKFAKEKPTALSKGD